MMDVEGGDAIDWNKASVVILRDVFAPMGREDGKVGKVVLMISVSWIGRRSGEHL